MKRECQVVECPKSMVGRVIGKNGETIKALQTYTGALIQIDQTVEPTKVTISGTPHSLNLAVSMVNDIVKGTFKGFALLRQVTSPASLRAGAFPPQHLAQPRPVYAPGYGLIPPSQLYGGDDRADRALAGPYVRARADQQQLQAFPWAAAGQVTPSQVILGLQPVGARPNQGAGQLFAPQLQVQQAVYGVGGNPYGGLAYYPAQDYAQVGGALPQAELVSYQDPSMYQLAGGNNAKLIQAANAKGARQWPKVASNPAVNELLNASNGQAGAAGAGNLVQVVDQEGKVYYYNPEG